MVHWDEKDGRVIGMSLKDSFEAVVHRYRLSRRDVVVMNAGVHFHVLKELLRKQVSAFVRFIDDHAANKPRVIWRETSPQFWATADLDLPHLANATACEPRDIHNEYNPITDPLIARSSSIRVLRTWQLSNAEGSGIMKGLGRVRSGRVALDCTHLCMPSIVLDRWNVCLLKGLAELPNWLPDRSIT